MKYLDDAVLQDPAESSPSRGTWIEINIWGDLAVSGKSSPSRGTWIEIKKGADFYCHPPVVPLTGDVD